jgi:hypothetical protein
MGLEPLILHLLKSRKGRAVVALMLTTAGILFALLLFPQLEPARALARNHAIVSADVIDARVSTDMHGFRKSYDIRNRFRLSGHGPWFHQTERGALARNELWSSLSKAEWDAVTRRGRIDIVYLPSDPSVNALARDASHLTRDAYFGVGISLLFSVPGVLWLCWVVWSIGTRLANFEVAA